MKLLSADCNVENIFLSICELTLLELMVILACNSCALAAPIIPTLNIAAIRNLLIMKHFYNSINDIPGNLLLGFTLKSNFFAPFFENGDLICIDTESSTLVIQGIQYNHICIFALKLVNRIGLFIRGFQRKSDQQLTILFLLPQCF